MTIKEWIKSKILKLTGVERLGNNPNDERLDFISDDEAIRLDDLRANRIWYVGNGDELLNFYTENQVKGFFDNPVYNRNKRNYFWSQSAEECKIKRVHSGIPHAIIDTISNIVGTPVIDDGLGVWDEIAEENDFYNKLVQQSRPLTLAEGFGAWKININKELSDKPLLEFYDGEFVDYIYKSGILVGIVFRSFYKTKDKKNYVLLETRSKKNGNSYIEYDLFEVQKGNELRKVDFDKVPELPQFENVVINGLNKILAVPSRYFFDVLNAKYGRSIYAGKLDFFDMLDEIWSQASQTNRVSTPVEYYNPEVLGRGVNGFTGVPSLYNRQFVQKAGVPDGEGRLNDDIITTQPDLNFEKYGYLAQDVLGYILTGVLSPATLGIDVAKKDNAEAQREKEKISILTRDNIINAETRMVKDIVRLCLLVQDYIKNGNITLRDYDISVKYSDFANPSLESVIASLLPMLTQGGITPKLFVEKVVEELKDYKGSENIIDDIFNSLGGMK